MVRVVVLPDMRVPVVDTPAIHTIDKLPLLTVAQLTADGRLTAKVVDGFVAFFVIIFRLLLLTVKVRVLLASK